MNSRKSKGARPSSPMEVVELIAAQQGEHSYPVHVGPGAALSLPPLLEGVDRVALVSCRKVLSTRFGEAVAARVEATTPLAVKHVLADGEKGKTLAELERAAVALLEAGCTRRSLVIALGGGAVTDAGGFLAATFMRGIPWIAVPTTLLAMVDASIGGKTGANLPVAKNAVGAFHPPRAVLSDPSALTTLPSREMRSGMGEVLKYGARLVSGMRSSFITSVIVSGRRPGRLRVRRGDHLGAADAGEGRIGDATGAGGGR